MKKLTSFILGLLIVLPLSASTHYTLEEDGTYTYTGDPVNVINIDFTSWTISDLPSPLTDDMVLAEHLGLGFVKWKIASRNCGDKGTVNALFNNNNSDFSGGPTNPNTTNKPRIYLPTTATGVASIKVFAGGTSVYMPVYYKDDDHTEWTSAGSLPLTSTFAEYSLNLNTKGQTSIYIEYTGTAWPAITNLSLDMKEASLYELVDAENHIYAYRGESVDEINIDFSSWVTSDLPAQLTDDMELSQKGNLGFVKWKIQSYTNGNFSQNVLFNNNTGDAGVTIANNDANQKNPPRIYFPKTVRGIKSISISHVNTGQTWFQYTYTDANETKSQSVQTAAASAVDAESTDVITLNTTGPTALYITYKVTVWPRITRISFTLEDDSPTSLSETEADTRVIKRIENGQLVIIKNGVRYNILGSNF